MCNPKSKGGKRCSAHQAGSKFSKRVAAVKLGASDDMVNETFKELAREGKNLPTPSKEEILSHIEKKEFATEIDPALDAHERKIQLNQLERAKEERELASVTGGSFHAWKNLMGRVGEKMKALANRVKRPALALGLAGTVLFGAAGCGAQDAKPTVAPTSSPTSTSQPSTAPVDNTLYGDVIGLAEVTDENGTYLSTTISPDDDSMKLDPAKVDRASLDANGFTTDDALSAQQWTAKFVAEQGADSTALDNAGGWEAWKTEKADSYIAASEKDSILSPVSGSDRSAVILNNPNGSVPVFVRDGKPRLTSNVITVDKVEGYSQDGKSYIHVTGTGKADYRYSDEVGQASAKKANPDMSDDEVKAQWPEFFDGKDNSITYNSNWGYYLEKGTTPSGWGIVGYSVTFS